MKGAVEGTHSVFARKVWNKYDFSTLEEIDDTVARYQNAYREYSKTPKSLPGRTLDESFSWKDIFLNPFSQKEGMVIFLIRLVEYHTRGNSEIPAIRLFRDIVELEKVYLNQYVLAELDVFKGQLNIHIQPYREDLQLIKQVDFPVKMATSRGYLSFEP